MRDVDAIIRLQAWVKEFGHEKQKPFIDDLNTVLELARRYTSMMESWKALTVPIGEEGDE